MAFSSLGCSSRKSPWGKLGQQVGRLPRIRRDGCLRRGKPEAAQASRYLPDYVSHYLPVSDKKWLANYGRSLDLSSESCSCSSPVLLAAYISLGNRFLWSHCLTNGGSLGPSSAPVTIHKDHEDYCSSRRALRGSGVRTIRVDIRRHSVYRTKTQVYFVWSLRFWELEDSQSL